MSGQGFPNRHRIPDQELAAAAVVLGVKDDGTVSVTDVEHDGGAITITQLAEMASSTGDSEPTPDPEDGGSDDGGEPEGDPANPDA